jgi:hypothetical protein
MFHSLPSFPSFIGDNSVPAVIDGDRFTHEVTYTLTRHVRTDVFSPIYHYKWMMVARCEACNWSYYVSRNCETSNATVGECNITQYDKDFALMNHHRAVGIFGIHDGDFKSHIFVREQNGDEYLMKHLVGWQVVARNTENGWVEVNA